MSGTIDAWGGSGRYYAVQESEEDPLHYSKTWEGSVKAVNPDCRGAVKRAVRRWNLKIRNQLFKEMGFRLDGRQIQVRVAEGLPPPFAAILDATRGVETILLNQGRLRSVVSGTKFIESEGKNVRGKDGNTVGVAEPAEIRNVRKTAEAWLDLISDNDMEKGLAEIDEDIFGAYHFYFSRVDVYWLAIGIYANNLDVPIEALTLVVLLHELAHAYSHLGMDIDGRSWLTSQFKETDVAVIEGLAQFYTEVVCTNLVEEIPEAFSVFTHLMNKQSEIYRTHRKWVQEDARNCGEVLRMSLVEARRSGKPMKRKEFAEIVSKHRNENVP